MLDISITLARQLAKVDYRKTMSTMKEKVQAFCRTVEKTEGYQKLKATFDSFISCFKRTPIHERTASDSNSSMPLLQSTPRKSFKEGLAEKREKLHERQKLEQAQKNEDFYRRTGIQQHSSMADLIAKTGGSSPKALTAASPSKTQKGKSDSDKAQSKQNVLQELNQQKTKTDKEARVLAEKKTAIKYLLNKKMQQPEACDYDALINGLVKWKKSASIERRLQWPDVPAQFRTEIQGRLNDM